jgi:hypothetical protein
MDYKRSLLSEEIWINMFRLLRFPRKDLLVLDLTGRMGLVFGFCPKPTPSALNLPKLPITASVVKQSNFSPGH